MSGRFANLDSTASPFLVTWKGICRISVERIATARYTAAMVMASSGLLPTGGRGGGYMGDLPIT